MRQRMAALAAVAAAALASCTGLAPARRDAAALFDMDSYLSARGRLGAVSMADVPLPLPSVADTVDAVPRPALPAASFDGAAAAAPALPRVPGPEEIGIVARPIARTPQEPAALPAPLPPSAPATPSRAVSTKPAAAMPAATSASAAATRIASAANAATPAASTAQAAATTAAAASGANKVREVYARVGDEIEIGLDGAGYLFLGFADRQTDGMTFKARAVKDGKTYFTFKALKLGSWDLDFQQQDNATGATRLESVRVVVLAEEDFAAAVQRQTQSGGAVSEDVDEARYEWAEKLASLGRETQAIAEYLKGYREGNPELNDRIAALYARTGDGPAAEKYWRKNVGAASPWGDRAIVGIAGLAVARGDIEGYLAWHRQLLAVSAVPIDDALVDAALAAQAAGEVGLGIELLAEYGRRYPEGRRIDEAAFVSARLFEADSPFRDLKRSRDLYAAVLREFPESAHAAEAAERLRYLDQHFFTIR